MKINLWVKIAIAVGLFLLCIGGYFFYVNQNTKTQKSNVETTTVMRMDLNSLVSATGTIRPAESVEVSSKITARIKEVLVKENDVVKAGQLLAILDGKDYEAKREQAQFKVTNTRAKYERMRKLQGIGAKSDAELEDARYNYETAQSVLRETESDLNETIITAPMDGVVVGEPKTPGTMAVQGNSNPTVIMRLADLSKKEIRAKIDETDIGNVKIGQDATFTVDAFTDKKFTAHVTNISQTDIGNSWDTNAGTTSGASTANVIYYYVTLSVDDPENILLPAMTARVEINTARHENVLVVPLSTLKTDTHGSYVVLVNADGSQENRYVETGIYGDEYVEILSGLDEGDNIVSTFLTTGLNGNKQNPHGRPPF